MKRILLVDGNAVLHRAYHALNHSSVPLQTSKGEIVNAVFGYTGLLLRALKQVKPDYVAIAWDLGTATFRHQAYTQYKATRGPVDNDLKSQYGRVHEINQALNIPELFLEGYEADDIIGTLAVHLPLQVRNLEVIIMTGDRDIMQLIGPDVKVLMPKKTLNDVGLYGVTEFIEKYGFQPINLIDYKALAGDASDNIPGVQGIGDVTATKLIKQFTTLDNIYKSENLATLPPRTQQLLAEGSESAKMSHDLAKIEVNAPIDVNINDCQLDDFDIEKAKALFQELEFRSLLKLLPGVEAVVTDPAQSDFTPTPVQSENTTKLDQTVDLVLKKMTKNGIMIDLPLLEKLGKELKEKLAKIEAEIYHHVGHEFNIASPKQLGDVLFDELGLPVIRKTKTGRSTDEATLQELSSAHPAIKLVLQYRQLSKLINTYVDALPRYADDQARVHSTFNVEGAATGRLSSTEPNLQNIPIRGDLGGEVRKAFIVNKGNKLISADYSQIELRILAHLTNDPGLIKAFNEDQDIHLATAAKIFDIPLDQVSKEQRAVGKTMNFATMYGQGPHALSQQLAVDFKTAKGYIDAYFEEYPNVRDWKIKILLEAQKCGYVETLWGRRRYIPELKSTNRMLKSAGERAAVNHPVQGTQADMIKQAMIDIDKELSAISSQSSAKPLMVLQVHDELIFECPEKDVENLAKLVKSKMEDSLKLAVPVLVDVKVGDNWGEMTKIKV